MTEAIRWDRWRPFPTINNTGFGNVPIRSGVFWLRNRDTNEDVFIGASDHVAEHLPELLLRAPIKRGSHAEPLQEYVTKNVAAIEYRTAPCTAMKQALALQATLRAEHKCLFSGENSRPRPSSEDRR